MIPHQYYDGVGQCLLEGLDRLIGPWRRGSLDLPAHEVRTGCAEGPELGSPVDPLCWPVLPHDLMPLGFEKRGGPGHDAGEDGCLLPYAEDLALSVLAHLDEASGVV